VVGTGLFPYGRGYAKLASWPHFHQVLATEYLLYDDRNFPPTESGEKAYRIYVKKNTFVASSRR
jgi:hypothetical protein